MTTARLGNLTPLTQAISGCPFYLGTIQSTGSSQDNSDTGTPFNGTGDALKGRALLIQADAACYVLPTTAATTAVTSGTGVLIPANGSWTLTLGTSTGWLAVISVSGTANVKVWEVL